MNGMPEENDTKILSDKLDTLNSHLSKIKSEASWIGLTVGLAALCFTGTTCTRGCSASTDAEEIAKAIKDTHVDYNENLKDIRGSLNGINSTIYSLKLEGIKMDSADKIMYRDVLGGPELEVFYEIEGKRVYLEIDGQPIGNYFPKKAERP